MDVQNKSEDAEVQASRKTYEHPEKKLNEVQNSVARILKGIKGLLAWQAEGFGIIHLPRLQEYKWELCVLQGSLDIIDEEEQSSRFDTRITHITAAIENAKTIGIDVLIRRATSTGL